MSQAFLIVRLYRTNFDFLEKVVNSIGHDAYIQDMNRRLDDTNPMVRPSVEILEEDTFSTVPVKGYDLDSMPGIDKSSTVALVNIGIELYLADVNPMKLSAIDSIASVLLKKENIDATFYTRIVDLSSGKVLEVSRKDAPLSLNSISTIKSNNIPLNFEQTKVLQLVVLNPLKTIFSQMTGMMTLSLLLCLLCIYCLYILQSSLARQKKLAQSKNDFYNQISHELKRPISIVYQAVDSLLNTKSIENKERRERYLNVSMGELQRMNSKIDMILVMSMDNEGMFELNKVEIDLPGLVKELVERINIPGSKPVKIVVDNKLVHPFIVADRDHLFQCISNLTDNAIKYSGDSVRIDIGLFEEQGDVCVSVRDNGLGISEENLGKIFEKFERVNVDKKMHGYGIGLSYVKQIVEKHGGTISVSSEFGKGSEFIIRLPQTKVS